MKRRIFKLGLFLLLGAIINTFVAWGCVLTLPPKFSEPQIELEDTQREIPEKEIAEMLRAYFHNGIIRVRVDSEAEKDQSGGYGEEEQRFGWKTIYASWSDNDLQFMMTTRLAGWPSYSLEGWFDWDNRRTEEDYYGALMVPEWATPKQGARRLIDYLPWHPICPGFAINTIFYVAIIWLLFAAPFQFRRYRRIKRGLCPACAYPVGFSDVCTECGKPVKA